MDETRIKLAFQVGWLKGAISKTVHELRQALNAERTDAARIGRLIAELSTAPGDSENAAVSYAESEISKAQATEN